MNVRLQQFLAAENITQAQLADTLNVARAGISHILAGRNKPSYDFLSSLMIKYPRLNIEWMMFGKGKMYKGVEETPLPVSMQAPRQTPADDYHEDLLFNDLYSDEEATVEKEQAPVVTQDSPLEATVPLSLLKTLSQTTQSANKQRKVSKIIVLFDDGSYQEL